MKPVLKKKINLDPSLMNNCTPRANLHFLSKTLKIEACADYGKYPTVIMQTTHRFTYITIGVHTSTE